MLIPGNGGQLQLNTKIQLQMEHENIRIIIVDDHKLIRETWRMLLESFDGLTVISTGTLEESLAALDVIAEGGDVDSLPSCDVVTSP